MKTLAMSQEGTMPLSNDSVNILDLLRVIGMQEIANNVFSIPSKKKK